MRPMTRVLKEHIAAAISIISIIISLMNAIYIFILSASFGFNWVLGLSLIGFVFCIITGFSLLARRRIVSEKHISILTVFVGAFLFIEISPWIYGLMFIRQ
jgi:hypothetical protein